MELHSCRNCQLIDEVIANKSQNFDILTEENIALHKALIKARETILSLQSEIADLNTVIVAERQHNLQLYLQQQNQKNSSDVLMNVVMNANAKDEHSQRNFSYSKKIFKPTSPSNVETIPINKYNSLMSLYKEQQQMHQENVSVLQSLNENYITQLEEQFQKTRDHTLLILDMYTLYRKQFFAQKKENAKDHKTFLEAVDILTKANNKRILEIERNIVETTTTNINEQTKGVLNSLSRQIEKRDKLVNMLRQQQIKLDGHIQELEKQLENQQQVANEINDTLKKQLKVEKQKYSNLEQRRLFDFEGFRTDIQLCKKELAKIKNVPSKSKLEHEIENLQEKLNNSYLTLQSREL